MNIIRLLSGIILGAVIILSLPNIAYADYESHGSFKSKFYGPVYQVPFFGWVLSVLR